MALRVKTGIREARDEMNRDFDDILGKIDHLLATELVSFDKVKQNIVASEEKFNLSEYAIKTKTQD